MTEWVETSGTVFPASSVSLTSPEKATKYSINCKIGDIVKKDAVLAILNSDELQHQLEQIQFEIQKTNKEIKIKELEKELLQQKVKLEIDDEKKSSLEFKKLNQAEIEICTQKVLLLTDSISHLNKLNDQIKLRIESLKIIAPIDGVILQTPNILNDAVISPGSTLFIIANENSKKVEMHIPENQIIKIKLGNAMRYAPSTCSIYESDYFWGKIINISPIATVNKNISDKPLFTITADITLFANQPIDKEKNRLIPFGSNGKCAIAIGKKSLLKQLSGW